MECKVVCKGYIFIPVYIRIYPEWNVKLALALFEADMEALEYIQNGM